MKPEGAVKLNVVPVTLPVANRVVAAWHRHHAPIPAGFVWWCVAAATEAGAITAVAIAGRPTNRNNDDGQTVEVLRVASDGTPNACSAVLSACGRAGRAIGARRVITYTLDSESGASLRGAGWVQEADGITSSWMKGTSRRTAVMRPHMDEKKARWALNIRPAVPVLPLDLPSEDAGPSLFSEVSA
jgi:hypothetical protein